MDEAIAFINDFIAKEHAAFTAAFMERDEATYHAKRTVVQQMYASGLVTQVNRPPAPAADWFARADQHLAGLQPRLLFQVTQYHHPTLGAVYRCYVSSFLRPATTYFASLYVAQRKRGLRIVAHYTIDGAHATWTWRGGLHLDQRGPPSAVQQFQVPTHPSDQADYHAAAAPTGNGHPDP